MVSKLTDDDVATYRERGYVAIRDLLDPEQVNAMLLGLDRLLCAKHPGLARSDARTVSADVHEKVLALAARDRGALAQVYDAVRKLLPFWSTLGGEAVTGAVRRLLATDEVGVVFRGAGIRLDLPDEDRWRSAWHQEYHSQISSERALVAWFGLVPVTLDMGPVQILPGSHREGVLPVRALDPLNRAKDYTRTFEIAGMDALLARYETAEHETGAGDVVFIDFRTVHQSGFNRSAGKSRVTCQVRYFDMSDPAAVARGWCGGWQENRNFVEIHPERVVS